MARAPTGAMSASRRRIGYRTEVSRSFDPHTVAEQPNSDDNRSTPLQGLTHDDVAASPGY